MVTSSKKPRTEHLQIQDRVIEMKRLKGSELAPHPSNWREHPPSQRHALRGVLEQVGIAGGLLAYYSEANNGKLTLLDGHLRQEDYAHLEWPVIILDVNDAEADVILATHDPLAAFATANSEKLRALLDRAKPENPRIGEMFQVLRKQLGIKGRSQDGDDDDLDLQPDDTRGEEYESKWGTAVGQLWYLRPGKNRTRAHRLWIGDATDPAVPETLLHERMADLLLTDPPYNVEKQYAGYDDDLSPNEYAQFTERWWAIWQPRTQRQIVTPGTPNLPLWYQSLTEPRHTGAWVRTNSTVHSPIYGWAAWDPILFFGTNWPDHNKRGSDVFEYPITVQQAEGVGELTGLFPCPKPLALWIDLLEHYASEEAEIVDPFAGSGTTLVAAERVGLAATLVEQSPRYAALILERAEGLGLRCELVNG